MTNKPRDEMIDKAATAEEKTYGVYTPASAESVRFHKYWSFRHGVEWADANPASESPCEITGFPVGEIDRIRRDLVQTRPDGTMEFVDQAERIKELEEKIRTLEQCRRDNTPTEEFLKLKRENASLREKLEKASQMLTQCPSYIAHPQAVWFQTHIGNILKPSTEAGE